MTRSELLEKLTVIDDLTAGRCRRIVRALIEQINDEGVLDVQAPTDIAESMQLPDDIRKAMLFADETLMDDPENIELEHMHQTFKRLLG